MIVKTSAKIALNIANCQLASSSFHVFFFWKAQNRLTACSRHQLCLIWLKKSKVSRQNKPIVYCWRHRFSTAGRESSDARWRRSRFLHSVLRIGNALFFSLFLSLKFTVQFSAVGNVDEFIELKASITCADIRSIWAVKSESLQSETNYSLRKWMDEISYHRNKSEWSFVEKPRFLSKVTRAKR